MMTVVKIGGKVALDAEAMCLLAGEMEELRDSRDFVLVHGGGVQVTDMSRRLGFEPSFRDGVRITTEEEMEVVDMVLSGRVNKELVRLLRRCGLNAVGLSGADGRLVTGARLQAGGRTGEVREVDPSLLRLLVRNGYLPVLCSTAADAEGGALNINADSMALAVARALASEELVFLSDVPGILRGRETIGSLSLEEAEAAIADRTITGGMVPKVRASVEAVRAGVGRILIADYRAHGDLRKVLAGGKGSSLTGS